ncbi:hypothetical protein [Nocardia gamkensis]
MSDKTTSSGRGTPDRHAWADDLLEDNSTLRGRVLRAFGGAAWRAR